MTSGGWAMRRTACGAMEALAACTPQSRTRSSAIFTKQGKSWGWPHTEGQKSRPGSFLIHSPDGLRSRVKLDGGLDITAVGHNIRKNIQTCRPPFRLPLRKQCYN